MKEKPQNLNYFSFSFVLLSFIAILELLFSWKYEVKNPFQYYSCAFLVMGIWGMTSAWEASTSVVAVIGLFWAFILTGYYTIFKNPALDLYQLFAFDLCASFIYLQTIWFCCSFLRVVSRPQNHWWKTPRRVSVELRAIIRTEEDMSFMADIRNLSKEGFLVGLKMQESDVKFELGKPVSIHFVLQSSGFVQCLATVVRHHSDTENPESAFASYGMKITGIDPQSKRHIEHFVSRAAA